MKKKRLLTLIGSVCLILVLAALLLPACAPKVVEAPELEAKIKALEGELTSEKAEVSNLEKKLAEAAKPAEVFEWKLQTITSSASLDWLYCWVPFCEDVERLSGGRLVITPYAAGTLCPSADIFKSVAAGMFEMGISALGYHTGFMPEGAIGKMPFALRNLSDVLEVFYNYGFLELFRESHAEHGLYLLDLGSSTGIPIISRVPVKRVDDLKGMKIRTIGALALFCDELGMSTVYIPGTEVYTALAAGTVDAATWGPINAFPELRWHEPAKYIIDPPISGGFNGWDQYVNMDTWNSLPSDLQAIVQQCTDLPVRRYKMDVHFDSIAREEMEAAGVTWCYLPEEDYPRLEAAGKAVWTHIAESGPRAKELIKVMTDYMRSAGYTDYKID